MNHTFRTPPTQTETDTHHHHARTVDAPPAGDDTNIDTTTAGALSVAPQSLLRSTLRRQERSAATVGDAKGYHCHTPCNDGTLAVPTGAVGGARVFPSPSPGARLQTSVTEATGTIICSPIPNAAAVAADEADRSPSFLAHEAPASFLALGAERPPPMSHHGHVNALSPPPRVGCLPATRTPTNGGASSICCGTDGSPPSDRRTPR